MSTPETTAAPPSNAQALVLRNTLILVIGQVAAMPLSFVINAVMARQLGPSDFGAFYLASTYVAAAFLLVEWGQVGTLPSLIAKDRARAPALLGSALAWRLAAAPAVFLLAAVASVVLSYERAFQLLFAMFFVSSLIGSVTSACQDAVRGFERTDVAAYATVGTQLLGAALVIPTLLVTSQLPAVVTAFAAANVIVLAFVWRGVRSTGIRKLAIDRAVLAQLAIEGTPFFFFALTISLQPIIDALYLSKLVPDHVIGWHAAARKVTAVLVFPASALVQAQYPTMCRLHATDLDGYRDTARSSVETSALAVVPLAIGCFLYADVAIRLVNGAEYLAAADNLRMMAPFVLLVYFGMVLGSCLLATGKHMQRKWTFVQALCIVVSIALDPILISWFQQRTGNGSLGVCGTILVSESMMVLAGIVLMPRGVFDRRLALGMLRLAIAGGAMFTAGRLMAGVTPFVAAPLVAVVYLVVLRAIGGLQAEQIQPFKDIIARKARRNA